MSVEATPSLLRYLPYPFLPNAFSGEAGEAETVFVLRERYVAGRLLYEVGPEGGGTRLASSVESAARILETCAQKFVAAAAQDFVFVHAGVVGWRGKAIVLPGRSFTGKSTLVMDLLRAGATYYSDEYAVIDRGGDVHSFNRRPRLRSHAGSAVLAELDRVTNAPTPNPLPVGMIVKTTYRQGARWRPQTMSPGHTLMALLENTVAVRARPEFSVGTLNRVVSRASGLRSDRDEGPEAARQILAC